MKIVALCHLDPLKVFVSLCPDSGWREGEDDKQCQRAYEGQQSPWRVVGGGGARSPHPAQRVSLSERRGRVLTEKKHPGCGTDKGHSEVIELNGRRLWHVYDSKKKVYMWAWGLIGGLVVHASQGVGHNIGIMSVEFELTERKVMS